MYDASGTILYVGKAKNLKNRLKSYFQKNVAVKTERLMAQVVDIKVTVTETENEALLLECNLIKKHKPRYNVLLRDDKTYPYIYLSRDDFPRLDLYRGNKTLPGRYFGPYPGIVAVREALNLIQKLFLIRQCKNSFYRNRSRPCLQYQIGRCRAPCVDFVSQEEYMKDVEHAILFLEGKDDLILQALIERMQKASAEKQYEEAAALRDKVASLRQLQEQQAISHGSNNADVLALAHVRSTAVVSLLKIRDGRVMANQTFHPKVPAGLEMPALMQSFISQFYLTSAFNQDIPGIIISNTPLQDKALLAEVVSAKAGKRITFSYAARGERLKWLKLAELNAKNALEYAQSDAKQAETALLALQSALSLPLVPQHIECFDISHTSGRDTYASCVVFDTTGMNTKAYRRFKISGIQESDDYAAMHQAIKRRYKRLRDEGKPFPDILLVDGGKGQLSQAKSVLDALEIKTILLVGIAKGRTRKAGFETIFFKDKGFQFDVSSQALHLLQRIRDEAHRFAITGHRNARQKTTLHSRLEDIPGVGAVKRKKLLTHFGGLQGVKRASIAELCKVTGVNQPLAQKIYDAFHSA